MPPFPLGAMYAVLICMQLFADYMVGGHLRVYSANSSSIANWLMKGDCRDGLQHSYLSAIAACGVSEHCRLIAKHIPGAQNCMADALPRCQSDVGVLLFSKWKALRLDCWLYCIVKFDCMYVLHLPVPSVCICGPCGWPIACSSTCACSCICTNSAHSATVWKSFLVPCLGGCNDPVVSTYVAA